MGYEVELKRKPATAWYGRHHRQSNRNVNRPSLAVIGEFCSPQLRRAGELLRKNMNMKSHESPFWLNKAFGDFFNYLSTPEVALPRQDRECLSYGFECKSLAKQEDDYPDPIPPDNDPGPFPQSVATVTTEICGPHEGMSCEEVAFFRFTMTVDPVVKGVLNVGTAGFLRQAHRRKQLKAKTQGCGDTTKNAIEFKGAAITLSHEVAIQCTNHQCKEKCDELATTLEMDTTGIAPGKSGKIVVRWAVKARGFECCRIDEREAKIKSVDFFRDLGDGEQKYNRKTGKYLFLV